MRKKTAPLPRWTTRFALFFVALSCAACASRVQIGGQIIDADGTRLSSARVETIPPTERVVTDREGFFLLRRRILSADEESPIEPGLYRFRVIKENFRELTFEREIQSGRNWLGKHIMEADTPEVSDIDVSDDLQEANIDLRGGPKSGGF